MNWIFFVLFLVILWFLLSRMLPVKGLRNLTEAEVQALLKQPGDHAFLDVREVHEYRRGHIRGFQNIPLSQLGARAQELDPSRTVVLTCQSGMRSRQAARILSKRGFQRIAHLPTGVVGWRGQLVK